MVLDRFSHLAGIPLTRKNFSGLYGEGDLRGDRLLLLKPQTFMNLSGRSVAAALRFHKLSLQDMIVIHDDLDIPFGCIKIKEGGGMRDTTACGPWRRNWGAATSSVCGLALDALPTATWRIMC
jgi:peptidyl-tRNA hydrolase